jgi:hypothetical protein
MFSFLAELDSLLMVLRFSAMTKTTVPVPTDLRGCHPLITKTRGSLKLAKTDERNLKRAAGDGVLKVCVSRDSIDRALKILEAIIRACEARGWSVAAPDARSSAEIRIRDEAEKWLRSGEAVNSSECSTNCNCLRIKCAPERIRTTNLLIRSQMLYPVELRAPERGS